VFATIFALCYPVPGTFLSQIQSGQPPFHFVIVNFINNILIFLISGLQLRIEEINNPWDYKVALPYGLVTINFTTTLLAFALIHLPFRTSEFPVGLSIYATAPTTLGVGVALTIQAKGDSILSLILTITSNMLAVVTMPYLLQIYLSSLDINISPAQLIIRLIFSVLLPSILGIYLRYNFKTIKAFMTKYRVHMGIFNNLNLACIIWMTLSSARNTIIQQNIIEIICIICTSSVQYIFYLSVNYYICNHILKLDMKKAISVTIMASQKSTPVCVVIINDIAKTSSQAGLYVIPCVIGQLIQILIGSVVAKHFAKTMNATEQALLDGDDDDAKVRGVDQIENENGLDNTHVRSQVDFNHDSYTYEI